MVFLISGIAGFATICVVSLMIYGRVYLYDGYKFTQKLCTICVALMVSRMVLNVIGIILSKRKYVYLSKKDKVLSIILIVLSLCCSTILVINGIRNLPESSKSSSNDSSSSYNSSYEISHSTYCLLYMKISNVKVIHSGNYTYVSGTITNSGDMSIKYVKVKASCKDSSGTVIDTDWTYAVDSSWLDPGESNSFEMMIRDENEKIKTADVSVVYY